MRYAMVRWLAVAALVCCLLACDVYGTKRRRVRRRRSGSSSVKVPVPTIEALVERGLVSVKDVTRLNQLAPMELFTQGTQAHSQGNHWLAYTAFTIVRLSFPSVKEAHLNSAVALEALAEFDAARAIYEEGLKAVESKEDKQALTLALITCMQQLANAQLNKGHVKDALKTLKKALKKMPNDAGLLYNTAQLAAQLNDLELMEQCTQRILSSSEQSRYKALGLTLLCRTFVSASVGGGATLVTVPHHVRASTFAKAKEYCMQEYTQDPESASANFHLGIIYREGLDFESAISHLEIAHSRDPIDTAITDTLAGVLSRVGNVPRALELVKPLLDEAPNPRRLYSLGTMISPFNRTSQQGIQAQIQANNLVLKQLGVPSKFDPSCTAETWTLEEPAGVGQVLNAHPPANDFGSHRVRGALNATIEFPLYFKDKSTAVVKLEDAFLFGAQPYVTAQCRILALSERNTDLSDFAPPQLSSTTSRTIDNDGVLLMHPKASNYYHVLGEVFTRIAIMNETYPRMLQEYLLVLPPKSSVPAVWDLLELMSQHDEKLTGWQDRALEYDAAASYRFKTLSLVSFTQPNKDDVDQNDLWSAYLPSKASVVALRSLALNLIQKVHQDTSSTLIPARLSAPKRVIYISRSGVREVVNEDVLIKHMNGQANLHGYKFEVFQGADQLPNTLTSSSTLKQMMYFYNASLILGPHGAGLTNIIFAPSATLLEFTMTPQCNRVFGYLAEALDNEYIALPQVTAYYHLKYKMTGSLAKVVGKAVLEALHSQPDHLESREPKDEL
eukprot:m.288289 g.288289  ORF g.288289 m.288289 type:complete len:786 (-) comp15800_c1_seq1:469-2826(-)